MIVDKIEAYLNNSGKTIDEAILEEVSLLARWSFERQFGQKQETLRSLRLSSIGKCTRQQAYNVLGFDHNGKEIDARAKTVFFQGDMVELAIIQLMKVAGLNITECGKEQKTIYLDGIPGHPDGIFTNELNEKFLVSVKSMSSYSFSAFQEGIIDEGYLFQENSYLECDEIKALGIDKCVMVAQNKDAGVLHEHIIRRNPSFIARIKENIATLKSATKENLPPRAYSPDEKGFLPWQCLYCSFWKTCRPNAQHVLVKNKYKLQEK
jgi:hypothetical protein